MCESGRVYARKDLSLLCSVVDIIRGGRSIPQHFQGIEMVNDIGYRFEKPKKVRSL